MARNLKQKKKTDSTYVFRMSFSLFYDTSLLDHCHATVFRFCFYNIIITYFTRSEVVGQKFYFILVFFLYTRGSKRASGSPAPPLPINIFEKRSLMRCRTLKKGTLFS